jgi:hypothetical protein
MTKLSLDRNFFEAEKLAESQPFSTVSQEINYSHFSDNNKKGRAMGTLPWLSLGVMIG